MNKLEITLAFLICLLCFTEITDAQVRKGSDMVVSGHGWYGVDIEQTRPGLKSYGYMTYEASVGFQTNPADSCAFAHAFGYPMIKCGLFVGFHG